MLIYKSREKRETTMTNEQIAELEACIERYYQAQAKIDEIEAEQAKRPTTEELIAKAEALIAKYKVKQNEEEIEEVEEFEEVLSSEKFVRKQIVREFLNKAGMSLLNQVISEDTPRGLVEIGELFDYCGWVLNGEAIAYGVEPSDEYQDLLEHLTCTYLALH